MEVRVKGNVKVSCTVILPPSSSPSSEKYDLSSNFWAGGDKARMLRAEASVMAPPNPFIFWNFCSGCRVSNSPENTRRESGCQCTGRNPRGTPAWLRVEGVTCACLIGPDGPQTQLHSAPATCALVACEGARGRQGQGVQRVTVRGIADTDHRAVAKAFGDAGAGTWEGERGKG